MGSAKSSRTTTAIEITRKSHIVAIELILSRRNKGLLQIGVTMIVMVLLLSVAAFFFTKYLFGWWLPYYVFLALTLIFHGIGIWFIRNSFKDIQSITRLEVSPETMSIEKLSLGQKNRREWKTREVEEFQAVGIENASDARASKDVQAVFRSAKAETLLFGIEPDRVDEVVEALRGVLRPA